MQTNHMLRCTICKSGTAMVEGEEDCYRQPFDCLKFSDDWKMWSFRSLRGSFQCGHAWDSKRDSNTWRITPT